MPKVMLTATKSYGEFLPYVIKQWRRFGFEPVVGLLGFRMDLDCDYEAYQPIEGLPDKNYSKVLRVIMTDGHRDEYCLLSDADMLPLDKAYFDKCFSYRHPECILYYTAELENELAGQYPICYMLAKGNVYMRALSTAPAPHLETLKSLGIWGKDFSDETYYKSIFKRTPKICLPRTHREKRLDRSNWVMNEGEYIDAHLQRPLNRIDVEHLMNKTIGKTNFKKGE